MNSLAQEAAIENVRVGSDDLKDKTNAKTNQFAAAARKPVSEYRLARLGSHSPSRSHIGRRGASDRISAVDYWRNRMARGKPRGTDDPYTYANTYCYAEAYSNTQTSPQPGPSPDTTAIKQNTNQ